MRLCYLQQEKINLGIHHIRCLFMMYLVIYSKSSFLCIGKQSGIRNFVDFDALYRSWQKQEKPEIIMSPK
jgi:hypothetical protein